MMFGGLFWLVLIIIFLYLLFRKVSEDNSHHHTRSRKQSALDILDEEYAKGNLSEEEYMRKKNNLRQ